MLSRKGYRVHYPFILLNMYLIFHLFSLIIIYLIKDFFKNYYIEVKIDVIILNLMI